MMGYYSCYSKKTVSYQPRKWVFGYLEKKSLKLTVEYMSIV